METGTERGAGGRNTSGSWLVGLPFPTPMIWPGPLISKATAKSVIAKTRKTGRRTLDEQRITEVFGIDVAPLADAVSKCQGAPKPSHSEAPENQPP